MDHLSGTAYLLSFSDPTSCWTFSKPDWRHFCVTSDLAHLVYFILILRSTDFLINNKNNNNKIIPKVTYDVSSGALHPTILYCTLVSFYFW